MHRNLREAFTGLFLVACSGPSPAKAPPSNVAAPIAEVDAAAPILPHKTLTIDSKALGETRRINLYIPAGHETERLPLLYMPDGGEQEDFPHVIAAVDAGIHDHTIRPLIVIGIENTERRRDMTGPTEVAADKKIAVHVGGSAAFRTFLQDELMPVIATQVHGNGHTAIIGESLAGLFIMETFFLTPNMFETYIALSPSLWWNDQALVRGLPAWRKAHAAMATPTNLYIASAGDDDIGDSVHTTGTALANDPPKGLSVTYEPKPNEKHATIYAASERPVLQRYFP